MMLILNSSNPSFLATDKMVRADLENTIDFEASSSAKATFVEQGKAFSIDLRHFVSIFGQVRP